MNDIAPLTFTVTDAEAAKNLAREKIFRESRLVLQFPANAELLTVPPEDLVGSLVECNGHTLKITSWCDAWDSEKGLQRLFTAHELDEFELAAREER